MATSEILYSEPAQPALTATERAYNTVLGWIETRQIGAGSVLDERRLSAALQKVRQDITDPELSVDGRIETWHAGDELHDLVCEYCSNRSLSAILKDARRRIRISNVERVPGRNAEANSEHLAIVDALLSGDPEQAREIMRKHLENIAEGYLAAFGVRSEHGG